MISTILIAGGTGLVGRRLIELLEQQGKTVRLLTRSPKGKNQFAWDPAKGTIDEQAVFGVDAVINLAGAGIADARWTTARKKLLIDSRVQSTNLLHQTFVKTGSKPSVYLSASAIGIYGNSGEEIQTEDQTIDQQPNRPFMVDCCDQWEKAAMDIEQEGIRTALFRIGIVLDKNGGALAEISKPIHFGLAAYFGDGKAWYSWIHNDDLCNLLIWAVQNHDIKGIYNAVAPNPVRNLEFVKTTAFAMKKWAIPVPAPSFALQLLMGEMAAVVLNSNRVSANKLLSAGFHFEYPTLKEALVNVYK